MPIVRDSSFGSLCCYIHVRAELMRAPDGQVNWDALEDLMQYAYTPVNMNNGLKYIYTRPLAQ